LQARALLAHARLPFFIEKSLTIMETTNSIPQFRIDADSRKTKMYGRNIITR
jgi:hypothetical protein